MKTKRLETFVFENAQELKDFLNQFEKTDLKKIPLSGNNSSTIVLGWNEIVINSEKSHGISIY